MFPPRKKRAKVKQGMQILHQVAFNDEISNSNLLDNIIQGRITKKAVVKRPINAEFLSNKKPSSQLKGKTNRFDIYVYKILNTSFSVSIRSDNNYSFNK